MKELLGLDLEPRDLTVLQVCLRGVIVFIVTLILVRLAHKRFMSRMTAFDVVLGLILASMLARAVNGSAAFFPTLVGGLLLVLLHRGIAAVSYHSHQIGSLVKGHAEVLVENGKTVPRAMRRHKISHSDLLEEARLNGKVESIEEVRLATLERSGQVSVVKAEGSNSSVG